MTPFNLPLFITKGVTSTPVVFNFKDTDNTPFPLTDWQVKAHARRYKSEKDKLDLLPSITDPANGEVTMLAFTDEQTAAMTASDYGWDMLLTSPSGATTGPYFAGTLKIQETYTRNV